MLLTAINVHPVKSTAARPLGAAEVLLHGLRDDRSWMVVDAEGRLVSAREVPALLHLVADTPATDPALDSALRLRAPGRPDPSQPEAPYRPAPDLLLDRPRGARVPVRLFGVDLEAVPAGDRADSWLRRVLGRGDLRLVWCDDPARRRLDPARTSAAEHAAFPDAYPVTLASLSSLRLLDEWVTQTALERGEEPPPPLAMERFRPNLVVDGEEPFAEDGWEGVQVGGVAFRMARPTGRCVMTTLDPVTLEGGHEPIRTLARRRRAGRDTLFAVHLVPETTGRVAVGQPVTARVTSSSAPPAAPGR